MPSRAGVVYCVPPARDSAAELWWLDAMVSYLNDDTGGPDGQNVAPGGKNPKPVLVKNA